MTARFAARVARATLYVGAIGVVIALGLLGPNHQVLAQPTSESLQAKHAAQPTGTDVPASETLQGIQVPARDRAAQAQAPAARVDKPRLVRDPAALQQAKRTAADRAAASQRGLGPVTSSAASLQPYGVYNGTNFAGISAGNGAPSDSTGAIGPTHYVEMVNSAIGVRARAGTTVTTMGLGAFGAKNVNDCVFDPQISWDQQSGRWLYSFDGQVPAMPTTCSNITSNYVAYGWSKNSDPSDLVNGWCHFYGDTGTNFFDYDKLGHDNNFMTIGANVFNSAGMGLTSVVVAISKPGPGFITLCPASTQAWVFGSPITPLRNADGTFAFTPVPADTADNSPAGYVVAAHDPATSSANKLMVWHLSCCNAGSPILTADGDVTVGAYKVPPPVPQPATGISSCSTSGNCLDSLDARLTQAVAHFDPDAGVETIWTQHAVTDQAVGTRSVERWYELVAGQSSPRQSGNLSDLSLHIFNGAISPSSAGNEAIMFYNAGNGSTGGFASMRAQSRNSATPLGTMSNETIIASSTVNDNDASCGVNRSPAIGVPCRWGDYSGARPDPLDANAVWGTSMLTGTGGTSTTFGWATQVAAYTPGCVSATIAPKIASGLTGSINQFTATSTGCSNPRYQFMTQNPAGTGPWVISQAFGPSAVWNWDSAAYPAGTYAYALWANQAGDSTATWEAFDSGSFTLTQAPPCSSATFSPPNSSVPVGTTLNFGATATGCPMPMFQYWLQDSSGTSSVQRAFSADSTWAWNTTGLVPGTYKVIVWANQRGDSTAAGEATATTTLTLTGCASVSVSANPGSPQAAGTSVTFTASGSGCPNPRYQFWTLAPNSTTWTIAQPYSPTATFSWNTTGLAVGAYRYTAWVRDAASAGASCNNLGCFDAYFPATTYTLTTTNCTSVTESAAPPSTATAGTSVTFTASASGCANPRYQFWTLAPGSSTWTVGQPYSSTATFAWNTSGLVPGSYTYTVWVRDLNSGGTTCNNLGCFDAYAPAAAYTLTSTPPCTSVTESAAPPSTATAGISATFTASASGCPNPRYQFWTLAPGSTTWTIGQPYSPSTTFTWNTTGLPAGSYTYTVWARDAGSAGTSSNNLGSFDAYSPATAYTLTSTPPCTSVTESAAPPSTATAGTTVTFTASGSGCTNPRYQFWTLAPGSTTWTIAQPYSPTATFTWNTTGLPAGSYTYTVWVRDAGSSGTCNNLGCFDAYAPATAYALTSTPPCTSVTESATPPLTAPAGTAVTFTASASGCANPRYQFWILAPGSTTWTIGQPYSPSTTFTWNTTGLPPGTYRYTVWARDAGSAGTACNNLGCFDAYFPATNYTLTIGV